MPEIANVNVDMAALVALGFLGAVLIVTASVFVWLVTQGGKRKKPRG